MGQALTVAQFFVYGKKHFTRTGWIKASEGYAKGALDVDLSGKVYAVTGANSGIGYEMAKFLASKGGTLFMMCRNPERGEKARQTIAEETKSEHIHLLIGDVSLASDVDRLVGELGDKTDRLDALVCNAGALVDKRMLTAEGNEVTFACHLLNGSYRLSSRLMPLMKKTTGSRVVLVTSGGMYNTKWPSDWDKATGQMKDNKFDGQLAYAYAKRGQVILAERWAKDKTHEPVKVVTAHPGWTATPGVDAAYGKDQKWLEPLRTTWEGAEGICWLCVRPTEEIENGALYLDRSVQRKHLPGIMFGEVTSTMNTPEQVDTFMRRLEDVCSAQHPPREGKE